MTQDPALKAVPTASVGFGLDFQRRASTVNSLVFQRAGQPTSWIALPHALDICRRTDGSPEFRVDLIRSRESLTGSLGGYGIVDMRLTGLCELPAIRSSLSSEDVVEGAFEGGWLRLLVTEPGTSLDSTVLPPVRIGSNGLGSTRLTARLTAEGVALLKRALLEGTVLVEAWAEMEISGIAPREPFVAELQASSLARALAPHMRDGLVTREQVVDALTRPEVIGEIPRQLNPATVAEAVADRLRNLCASHVPSPGRNFTEWWRMHLATGDTRLRFDLAQPIDAVRMTQLRFDPVGLLRAAGFDRLGELITERELLSIDTGFDTFLVSANIPAERSPVLSCGAEIVAPPAPPRRMHALRETVEFVPPTDRVEITLRRAPGESRHCTIETFLFTRTTSGVQQCRGTRREHPGGDVQLTAGDFAARWFPISASGPLVTAGIVTVTGRWNDASQSATLTSNRRTDTLVLPAIATSVEFDIELRSGPLSLARRVAEASLRALDLPIFEEYGAHTVEIEVELTGGPDVLALDVVAETDADDPGAVVTISFTRTRSTRSWSWFARSPFAPGFRYRIFVSSGPPRSWSEPQSAFAPLRLRASDLLQVAAS